MSLTSASDYLWPKDAKSGTYFSTFFTAGVATVITAPAISAKDFGRHGLKMLEIEGVDLFHPGFAGALEQNRIIEGAALNAGQSASRIGAQ